MRVSAVDKIKIIYYNHYNDYNNCNKWGVENVLTREMHDKQINIRISDEMNRQLMLVASLNRVSKSDIAREAMRRFLGTGGNLKWKRE